MRITIEPSEPLHGFLQALRPMFGTSKDTLVGVLCSSGLFLEWARKVGRCAHCGSWEVLDFKKYPPQPARHYVRNPDGDRPYWIPCPGITQLTTAVPEINPNEVGTLQAQLAHRIRTLDPDLL